ncbi:MAG TPA: response regulator transcription factor [Gaiellales bacterium]|nr:response regulator transcription factor [Gaiellales bacterium]
MGQRPQRLLVIEDDPAIARLLEVELLEAGYGVELAGTGSEGLAAIERDEPDMVLLDVRLPDLDGLSVCRAARRSGHRMPILMLTALDRVGDRVIGLDAGADDYLAKPFAVEELLARLRALARRAEGTGGPLEVGSLRLDPDTREASADGRSLELTAREFDLLAFLMQAPGRVFTREQIYEGVWGYSYLGDSKVIDYFVGSLRRKLGGNVDDSPIRTVRGVGYTVKP